MSRGDEDESVERFLELDGTVFFIDEKCQYRVKIEAKRVHVTPERPHGLSYSLTLHNSGNERILGFDNAHPVPARKGPSGKKHKYYDHKHRYNRTRVYQFVDTDMLMTDFYTAVDQILEEEGVKR
jgi:hypothetical protein